MSADWQTDVVVTVHDTEIELICAGTVIRNDTSVGEPHGYSLEDAILQWQDETPIGFIMGGIIGLKEVDRAITYANEKLMREGPPGPDPDYQRDMREDKMMSDGTPMDKVETLIEEHGFDEVMLAAFNRPYQPAHGYTRNVAPRGPIVRQEDAFPESCCESNPTPKENLNEGTQAARVGDQHRPGPRQAREHQCERATRRQLHQDREA